MWAELPVEDQILKFMPFVHNYYLDTAELEKICTVDASQDLKKLISMLIECVYIWDVEISKANFSFEFFNEHFFRYGLFVFPRICYHSCIK